MQNNNIDPESDIYNSNESDIDVSQTNGFMSIDSLYKKSSEYEINKINITLEKLEEEIHRYLQDIINMWNSSFKPFIESSDCFIFNNISDNTNYKNFFDFMCEQKTYKLMAIAKKRLLARREFLIKSTINRI
jgi:PDZ domain-containing secreted protein